MAAKYVNDTEIAKAKRDFELKKAAYDLEVNTKVSALMYVVNYVQHSKVQLLHDSIFLL